jgi:hypothetical protein
VGDISGIAALARASSHLLAICGLLNMRRPSQIDAPDPSDLCNSLEDEQERARRPFSARRERRPEFSPSTVGGPPGVAGGQRRSY